MARLIGAQRMVLQAIVDLPKDAAGYVKDSQLAENTKIAISDVRDWIETLEGEGYVEVARTGAGLSASITAQGKLVLRQFQPFGTTPPPASQTSPSQAPLAGPAQPQTDIQPAQPSAARSVAGQGDGPSQKVSPAATSITASTTSTPKTPVEVFFSYSHKDKQLRDDLEEHLALLRRQGVVSGWHDREILPGQEWAAKIDEHLESARLILLLISPSFLASDYCYDIEMKRAMERHEKGEAVVIPVIVRPCDWKSGPFAKLAALPANWVAVTSWANKDEAWTDVAQGIRRAIRF